MSKIVSYTVLLISLYWSATAQSVGHLGKTWILKTEVVNGMRKPDLSVGLERVVGRRASIGISVSLQNYAISGKGISRPTGIIRPRNSSWKMREISTIESGSTRACLVDITLRRYFDRILPAPIGFYSDLSIGGGQVQLTDFTVSYKLNNDKYRGYLLHARKTAVTGFNTNTNFLYLEFPSLGKQWIVARRLVIDAKFSLISQYIPMTAEMNGVIEHNYFLRTNTVTYAYEGLSIGPAAYLKLGILLF